MIIVERNYADRALILLRDLAPIFPDDYRPQLQLLEQQLDELCCDEDLIIFVVSFLRKYLLNKDNSQKKVKFFKASEEKNNSNIDGVSVKIEELIVALNWLIDGQYKTKFKGIIR